MPANSDISGGNMKQIRSLFCLIAIAFLVVFAVAQTPTGTIQGTVTDKTGAVVQGASISIVKTTTNEEHHATSDSAGRYTFVFVEPGNYNVTVEVREAGQRSCAGHRNQTGGFQTGCGRSHPDRRG
jgi:hypothetical protein